MDENEKLRAYLQLLKDEMRKMTEEELSRASLTDDIKELAQEQNSSEEEKRGTKHDKR